MCIVCWKLCTLTYAHLLIPWPPCASWDLTASESALHLCLSAAVTLTLNGVWFHLISPFAFGSFFGGLLPSSFYIPFSSEEPINTWPAHLILLYGPSHMIYVSQINCRINEHLQKRSLVGLCICRSTKTMACLL